MINFADTEMILFNLPELVILQGPQDCDHFDRHWARRRRPGCGGYSAKVVSREPGTVSSHGLLFWVSQSPIGASSIFHPPPVVHVRHNFATYVAPPSMRSVLRLRKPLHSVPSTNYVLFSSIGSATPRRGTDSRGGNCLCGVAE